jgi:hypothetical protein
MYYLVLCPGHVECKPPKDGQMRNRLCLQLYAATVRSMHLVTFSMRKKIVNPLPTEFPGFRGRFPEILGADLSG